MVNDKEFSKYHDGIFKPYFEKYIEYKRGKGEKVAHSTLMRICSLNNDLNRYDTLDITASMIEELLAPDDKTSQYTRQERISQLRQFSDFLRALGIKSEPVTPRYTETVHSQFRPYIFTEDEIDRLANAVDTLPESRRSNTHIKVYPVLIRILIGTGMRISEVTSLKISDIELDKGVICAVNCKNGVSRFIPMSDSLLETISAYIIREKRKEPESPLFVSPYTGKSYSYDAMKYMFHKLCLAAQICDSLGKTPNIHSLRHTFCTRSLEQMLASGMNLYKAVPILSAYVGHVNLADTERYIHFTEDRYHDFICKESSLGNLIPEVKPYE